MGFRVWSEALKGFCGGELLKGNMKVDTRRQFIEFHFHLKMKGLSGLHSSLIFVGILSIGPRKKMFVSCNGPIK